MITLIFEEEKNFKFKFNFLFWNKKIVWLRVSLYVCARVVYVFCIQFQFAKMFLDRFLRIQVRKQWGMKNVDLDKNDEKNHIIIIVCVMMIE